MGVTHVTVVIPNPADPEKTWEGLFLVESLGEPLFWGDECRTATRRDGLRMYQPRPTPRQ